MWLDTLADALSDHVEVLSDVPRELAALLSDTVELDAPAREALAEPQARQLLADLHAIAAATPDADSFARATSKEALKALGDKYGLKGRSLFRPIRVAATGSEHGIELALLLRLLGPQRVTRRMTSALG